MLALLLSLACTALAAERPNILFIIWDDAGLGDLEGFPNAMTSKPRLETPNALKLASEGMRFLSSAYTGAPVCAPSRNALWTGLHNGHISGTALTNSSITMAQVMSQAGYDVGITGKWGLADGNPRPKGFPERTYRPPALDGHPTRQGFSWVQNELDNQWSCHCYYPYYVWNGDRVEIIKENLNASESFCGANDGNCSWFGDMVTDAATSFLSGKGREWESYRAGESSAAPDPFMLYVSFTSPHAGDWGTTNEVGIPAPNEDSWPYKAEGASKGWPSQEVQFATSVSETDRATGVVLNALEKAGLAADTLVMLVSDNGAHNEGGHNYTFFNSSSYLNGFKRSIHDGGIRTPAIARWPSHITPGSTTAQQFAFYDVLPTLAELAGAKPLPKERVDGTSFAPVLLDSSAAPTEMPFVYHQFGGPQDPGFCSGWDRKYPHGCQWGQAVKVGNLSAVCLYPNGADDPTEPVAGVSPVEAALFGNRGRLGVPSRPCAMDDMYVYDLSTDPGQTTDIKGSQPAFVAKARALFVSQYNPGQ